MKLSAGSDISLFKQIANDFRTQAAFKKSEAESLENQADAIDHFIEQDIGSPPPGESAGPSGPPPDDLGK